METDIRTKFKAESRAETPQEAEGREALEMPLTGLQDLQESSRTFQNLPEPSKGLPKATSVRRTMRAVAWPIPKRGGGVLQ